MYIYIYIYICKVILFLQKSVSVNARNYFCRKVSVNARKLKKLGKRECDFSSLVFHVSHPNCPLSLSDFAAPKVFSLYYFSGCIRPESPALFSYSFFFVFVFFSLCSYTVASISHQNKISLSKEEIKGLTLKFQLQRLGK